MTEFVPPLHWTSARPRVGLYLLVMCCWLCLLGLPACKQTEPPTERPTPVVAPLGQDLVVGGLSCAFWKPEKLDRTPVVVFSHGFGGGRNQSCALMQGLAKAGYLVIAPDYSDSQRLRKSPQPEQPFDAPERWTSGTFAHRNRDLRLLLKLAPKEKLFQGADFSNIALAGHSLGGYTSLASVGGWKEWDLKSRSIKCVLAWSPFLRPMLDNKGLAQISVPVMLQGGTRDTGMSPFLGSPDGAMSVLRCPSYYIELEEADHVAWCDQTHRYDDLILHYSVGFLNRYLKGSSTTDLEGSLEGVTHLEASRTNLP